MFFSFHASRVVFGAGSRSEIAVRAARLGSRCLLVTGGSHHRHVWLHQELSLVMDALFQVSITAEPEIEHVQALATEARRQGCSVVVAMGGGSVLDVGKAVAALITNTNPVYDYLEVVGRGLPLEHPPVPMVAAPTTAGTGSEVTANAVLSSPAHGVKVSLRSPLMIPAHAIVDPELTLSLPPGITASTGMDALTQLIEAFVSRAANPLTDPLCRDGMLRAGRSLATAVHRGDNLAARTDMALASLFSGMALANAKLGAVHGFAAPLGAALGAAHGEICAALLPFVMEANIAALRRNVSDSPALARYREVAVLLTGDVRADAGQGVDFVRRLCVDLGIGTLHGLGLRESDVPELAEMAARTSSMKGNPVALDLEQLVAILRNAMNGDERSW